MRKVLVAVTFASAVLIGGQVKALAFSFDQMIFNSLTSISGTFQASDNNGDGTIAKSELTSFSAELFISNFGIPGKTLTFGTGDVDTFTYDLDGMLGNDAFEALSASYSVFIGCYDLSKGESPATGTGILAGEEGFTLRSLSTFDFDSRSGGPECSDDIGQVRTYSRQEISIDGFTVIPLPASFFLLLSGVVGLWQIGRKRHFVGRPTRLGHVH